MKTLILVRHAMPQIPFGERWCIGGQTDIPLSRFGRVQASLLAFAPELKDLDAVFSSPLCRTLETARSFCASPRRLPELREQEMGVWDGLSFREIRERWPGLYAARESDPSLLPDGAESTEAVTARMRRALSLCLAEEGERAALVSHRGAIAAITGNRSAIGYASLSILSERDGSLVCEAVGRPVRPEPDDAVCLAMLKASGADEKLTAHSLAVAETACDLCRRLASAGFETDEGSVRSAALLHDLAKGEAEHAAAGGFWLRELGYSALAEIVRQHTEPDSDALNEAGIVFLADKLVRGDRPVSLEERFAASLPKCRTPEARAAHGRRYRAALSLRAQIDGICASRT